MDKIDLLILSIAVSVMILCFSLATKWSYFLAGICSAFALVVIVGRMAQSTSRKQQEGQWDNFISNLSTDSPVKA